jgi:hypothetical protein
MYCPNRECIDFEETGEPGEYRDDVEVCPKCGARLVHERLDLVREDSAALADGEGAGLPQEPLVAAAAFNYQHEANLVALMLRANGVPAVVFDGSFGVDPRPTFGSRARVMVSERDLGLARALLEQEARAPEGEG